MCVSILESHLLMTLSKAEGGACVYMRGARIVFYSNTQHCGESEDVTKETKKESTLGMGEGKDGERR